jgi:hypothetical protein
MTRLTEREFAALTGAPQPPKRKYNNTIVERDGMKFDSQRELDRWCELQVLERAGEIRDLCRQVPYELRVNGMLVCRYVADFAYISAGMVQVEDVKGVRTHEYIIKRKLMMAVYGIEIKEVK